MNERHWSTWLLIIALPIIVGVFYLTAAGHFRYTPDDTYIYLQTAKNFVHGNGMSFNAGEPSYGFTSPLWLFIISIAGWLKIDLYVAAKVIDLTCASLALLVLYLLAHEVMRDTALALCATVAFSVNAWLLRWAGSGMETSLAVVLVLAVFLFCMRNEYFLSIVFAAMLATVRPESVVIVPFVLFDLYINSWSKRYAFNMAGALLLIYAVALAPWLIYARTTFGTFLPNTAYAKAGLQLHVRNALLTAADILKTLGVTEGCALVVLLIAGAGLLLTRKKSSAESESPELGGFFIFRQSVISVGWIVTIPLLYIATDVNVVSRYLLLITPIVTVFAFSFLHAFVRRLAVRRYAYTAVIVVAALMMLQNQFFYRRYVAPGIQTFEQGMETCIIPIATWLKENAPPGSRVALGDIGAIGYYSGVTICDAAGLITPSMLALIRQGNQPNDIIEKKLYRGLCDVDYVVDRSSQPQQLGNDSTLIPMVTRPFYGMTLSDPQMSYYTIYKVRKGDVP